MACLALSRYCTHVGVFSIKVGPALTCFDFSSAVPRELALPMLTFLDSHIKHSFCCSKTTTGPHVTSLALACFTLDLSWTYLDPCRRPSDPYWLHVPRSNSILRSQNHVCAYGADVNNVLAPFSTQQQQQRPPPPCFQSAPLATSS